MFQLVNSWTDAQYIGWRKADLPLGWSTGPTGESDTRVEDRMNECGSRRHQQRPAAKGQPTVWSQQLRHCEPAASLRDDRSDVVEQIWPLPLRPGHTVSVALFSKKKKKNNSQPDALLRLAESTLRWQTWHREALCSISERKQWKKVICGVIKVVWCDQTKCSLVWRGKEMQR